MWFYFNLDGKTFNFAGRWTKCGSWVDIALLPQNKVYPFEVPIIRFQLIYILLLRYFCSNVTGNKRLCEIRCWIQTTSVTVHPTGLILKGSNGDSRRRNKRNRSRNYKYYFQKKFVLCMNNWLKHRWHSFTPKNFFFMRTNPSASLILNPKP